jgi:hypothetical protein
MKNTFLIAFVLIIFLTSCNKNENPEPSRTNAELLSLNAWKLDRYTDTSGKIISNSSLNVSAMALFGLVFEFRNNFETRAIDKVTKNIINRGTWALVDSDTFMDINIDGFKGQFKVIEIKKGTLIIQASTGNFLSGLGTEINMEFSEFK